LTTHSPSRVGVKKEYSYTSTPLLGLVTCSTVKFTFTFTTVRSYQGKRTTPPPYAVPNNHPFCLGWVIPIRLHWVGGGQICVLVSLLRIINLFSMTMQQQQKLFAITFHSASICEHVQQESANAGRQVAVAPKFCPLAPNFCRTRYVSHFWSLGFLDIWKKNKLFA